MTTDEFIAALRSVDVDGQYEIDGFYSHGRPLGDGALYLHRTDDRWEVGVYERGVDEPAESFPTESEACNFFYDRMTRPLPPPGTLTPAEEEFSRQHTEAALRGARERIAAAKADHEARQRVGSDGDGDGDADGS
ncbi:MAG: hypothetical protein ACRDKB_13940 [Actinomycetota bacterium]